MGKVTIYLPDELEGEVRRRRISMSPICQSALKEAVNMEQLKEAAGTELEAVAERLRATMATEEKDKQTLGRELGTTWAREHATVAELQWATELAAEFWLAIDVPDDNTMLNLLHEAVGGRWGWHLDAGLEEYSFDRDPFLVAFFDAAAEVYRDVRSLL